eukprot:TRINITY_DN14444_c0_g1_i1.p1 TRINITY_DN14444_c0_g1~~TRINITY_DN14444_c0_g1_i1.p1  ORF type:complete len:447 (+),score=47.37 TRINITY_DN14444_c0_g1_i1:62-1402(+)
MAHMQYHYDADTIADPFINLVLPSPGCISMGSDPFSAPSSVPDTPPPRGPVAEALSFPSPRNSPYREDVRENHSAPWMFNVDELTGAFVEQQPHFASMQPQQKKGRPSNLRLRPPALPVQRPPVNHPGAAPANAAPSRVVKVTGTTIAVTEETSSSRPTLSSRFAAQAYITDQLAAQGIVGGLFGPGSNPGSTTASPAVSSRPSEDPFDTPPERVNTRPAPLDVGRWPNRRGPRPDCPPPSPATPQPGTQPSTPSADGHQRVPKSGGKHRQPQQPGDNATLSDAAVSALHQMLQDPKFQLLQQYQQRWPASVAGERPLCLDYIKGKCKQNRYKCKFAHPAVEHEVIDMEQIEPDGPPVCGVWKLTGFCKFGSRCHFQHPPLKLENRTCSPAITKKMQEFADRTARPRDGSSSNPTSPEASNQRTAEHFSEADLETHENAAKEEENN